MRDKQVIKYIFSRNIYALALKKGYYFKKEGGTERILKITICLILRKCQQKIFLQFP